MGCRSCCSTRLSEMGATVIKTEPLHGDAQRTQGPGFGCEKNDYEDPTFDLNNTNKDLVAINLKDEDGMKFMKKLLADADVFVVNLRDKALKNLASTGKPSMLSSLT